MNKDELIRENERLSNRVSQLFNDCSELRKKLTDVEDELWVKKERLKDAEQYIYFLAWMLYKEWVSVLDYGRGLKIEVVQKEKEE